MARKRLNKNVVVGLSLFVFLCMIVGSVLMLRQLQQVDPRHFEELARRYADDGQWQTASVFYRKAYEVSGDPAFLVSYGDTLLSMGEVGVALAAWGEALVKEPNLVPAHRRRVELLVEIARLYNRSQEWKGAAEAADKLLALDVERSDSDLALAHHARGLSLSQRAAGEPGLAAEGLSELERAAQLAPDEVDYSIDLAVRHVQDGRLQTAEEILAGLREKYTEPGPESAKARLAFARYLGEPRLYPQEDASRPPARIAEAEPWFQESIKLAAGDPTVSYDARLAYAVFLAQRWARAQEQSNDIPNAEIQQVTFQEAESRLRECISADPTRYEAPLQLAALFKSAKRNQDVVAVCEERLAQPLSRKGVEASRAKLNTFRLMMLASEACVAQAVEMTAGADSKERAEWVRKAQRFVDDAKGEFPNHPRVLSQAGRVKVAEGRDREALDDLRKAEDGYRASNTIDWENKIILARLHLRLGEPGAAKAVLQDVIHQATGPGGIPLLTLYAQVLMSNEEFDNPELDRALSNVLLMDPENSDAKRLQAARLARQGKTEQAVALVDSPASSAMIRARDAYLDGHQETALQILKDALEQDPADPRLVGGVVQELLALNRGGEAKEVVERALQERPDDPGLKRLAVIAEPGLSTEQRQSSLRALLEAEPDSFLRACYLADFHFRADQSAEAVTQLRLAEEYFTRKETPGAQSASVQQYRAILRMKLQAAAQAKDNVAMDEVKDAAARSNVDGAGGKSLLGLYHMYRDEWEEAVLALRAAIVAQPTHTRALTNLGVCLQRLGALDEAKTYYLRALKINPNEHGAHKGLAMIARAQDDMPAYEQHLAACERLAPADPWVRDELVAKEERSDPLAAIRKREAALSERPDDVTNLARLATLWETVKDTAKADFYFEKLLVLKPDSPELIVAASQYFRRTGRPERALALVRAHAESRPTDAERAEAEVLIAAHYLSIGDLDQVETTLKAAAERAPSFEIYHSLGEFYLRSRGRADLALPWYELAVERGRDDPANSKLLPVLSARIVCLLHRTVDDVARARQYVEDFRREFPDDPRGLIWSSEVHAREGRLDEAVTDLTRYLERRSGEPAALYQRAQHYAAQGRLSTAIEDLEAIKREDPRALELEPRVLLARLHYQLAQPDLAIRELESMVADAPRSMRAMELLVAAYIRAKRYNDADRIVTAQINRTDVAPDARWYVLRGSISADLKDYSRALMDFERAAQLSEYRPDSLPRILDTYAQLGQYDRGVAFYQSHAPQQDAGARLRSRYARLLALAGQSSDAVASFRQAMDQAIRGSHDDVRAVTVDLMAAFKDAATAVELFETNPPGGIAGRANDRILVRFYAAAERPGDAHARLERLIATAADDAERAALHLEQGELYHTARDHERARAAYEASLRYRTDDWIVLNNLAYLLSDQMQKPDQALPHARAAVRLAETADTLDTLGWIYVQLGDFAPAIAELSRVVRLNPEGAIAYYHLGEAYRRNSQFSEAAEILKSGAELARNAGDAETLSLIEPALELATRRDSAHSES